MARTPRRTKSTVHDIRGDNLFDKVIRISCPSATAIHTGKYRVSSDPRSQTCDGAVSTVMGDRTGILRAVVFVLFHVHTPTRMGHVSTKLAKRIWLRHHSDPACPGIYPLFAAWTIRGGVSVARSSFSETPEQPGSQLIHAKQLGQRQMNITLLFMVESPCDI